MSDYHHSVKTPGPLELPPPTLRPAARPTVWNRLVLYILRPPWAWRAELATANDRVPRIAGFQLTPAGELLRVRIPAGSTTTALAEAAEQLAVVLDVREVRVTRDKEHAALAQVEVIRRDPLSRREPLTWPWIGAVRCSLWQPIPSASTSTAAGSCSTWLSGTYCWVGSRAQASRRFSRCCWPPPRSIPQRCCTCLMGSWSSWPAGPAARSAST